MATFAGNTRGIELGSRQDSFNRWRWIPILVSIILISGCSKMGHGSFLHPHGPIAAEDRHLLIVTVLLMLIVIVPVLIFTPFFAWRYRHGNHKATYLPEWEFSPLLEGLTWGVPVMIVIVLSVVLWKQTHRLDPYRSLAGTSAPLDIQVVGLDWKWLFIYPKQHVATVNELIIPAGRPIHLSLTSDTVMQSFMVPELGGQIYAMAGMRTELNLLASSTGHFLGENTQYDGKGFQKQRFPVMAVGDATYDHWVKQVQSNGKALDLAHFKELSKLSIAPIPEQFGNVEPNLFFNIIGQYCPRCEAGLKKQAMAVAMPSHTKETP